MINLIISIIAGALAWGGCLLIFDSPWTGIWVFIPVLAIVFFILNRRTMKKIQAIMGSVEQMMQNVQSLPSEMARTHLIDKAIEQLKTAYRYKNYQFGLASNIDAQIGMFYYVQSRFKEAEPYLANAFPQNWTAVAMYGCLLYRKDDIDGMKRAFDRAIKYSRKQPMLYNLYAWCLLEKKQRDAALKVLNDGLMYNAGDETTKENLNLLKIAGKRKMRGYRMPWYQFLLEKPPAQQLMAQFAQRPGFRNH